MKNRRVEEIKSGLQKAEQERMEEEQYFNGGILIVKRYLLKMEKCILYFERKSFSSKFYYQQY